VHGGAPSVCAEQGWQGDASACVSRGSCTRRLHRKRGSDLYHAQTHSAAPSVRVSGE
jgi:hypothetical protein